MAEDEDVTPECYWTTTINTALIFWSDTVIPTNQARNLTKGHFCWRVHYNRVFSFTLSSIALQVSSGNITLSIDQKTHKPRQPLVILSFSDEKKKWDRCLVRDQSAGTDALTTCVLHFQDQLWHPSRGPKAKIKIGEEKSAMTHRVNNWFN